MDSEKRIITIDGVKLEVDLRQATRIDTFKVGDNVKVLRKTYGGYEVLPGAIIGFAEFASRPAIELAVVTRDGNVQFVVYTAKNEGEKQDIEIAPLNRFELVLDRAAIIDQLDRVVRQKENELADAKAKRKVFVECLEKAFSLAEA